MESNSFLPLFTKLGLVSELLPLYGYADQWLYLMSRLTKKTREIWSEYENIYEFIQDQKSVNKTLSLKLLLFVLKGNRRPLSITNYLSMEDEPGKFNNSKIFGVFELLNR